MKQLPSIWLQKTIAAKVRELSALTANFAIFKGPRRRALIDYREELRASDAELKKVCGDLEKQFLVTGESLVNLASQGDQFVKVSEELVAFATGRVSGSKLLFNAMQVAEQPMNFLTASRPKTERILVGLKQDGRRIDELISVQVELQQTVGPLKYIQTLFKIESAPLGGDVQAMFGALTKEIETLHDQVCELFTTRFLELRAVQRTLNQVVHELSTQTNELWSKINDGQAQIENSLRQLQRELAANQTRESHLGQLSKQINGEIQKVVMGLQFQDIINQKLQHTAESLARIDERLDSASEQGAIGGLCRLEAAQLQAVRKELVNAENTVKTGLTRALDHMVNADSQCLTLAEYNHLTTSADGMVQILFDTFATLREQISAMVASTASAYDKLRPVGGLASDLTHVVRDLSQRIHLIGLNAQIQAAQVEQGVGLEVLSARTSEISQATNRISETVARKLDELVQDLSGDVKALEALNTEAQQQQAALANAGTATEHSLHEMRNRALELLNQINTLIDGIRNDSTASAETVHYVATADAVLKQLETRFQMVAQLAGESAAGDVAQNHALLHEVRNSYTMTSERKVFAEVTGKETPAGNVTPEASVELFADNHAKIDAAPEGAKLPTVTLPPDTSTGQTPAPTLPPACSGGGAAAAQAGGTVELF